MAETAPGTEPNAESDFVPGVRSPDVRVASCKVAVACCLHDDACYLKEALGSFTAAEPGLPLFAFVGRSPWHGGVPGDWEAAAKVAEGAGATVVAGDWPGEREQRQAASEHLLSLGFTHALVADGDEVIEPALLHSLLSVANSRLAERVHVTWDTYWKSPEYRVRPRERFAPCYLIDLEKTTPVGGRHFEGGRPLLLGPEYGLVHHLSWVGPEGRIARKLSTWGHAQEVLPDWRRRVWRAWDRDKLLRDLHPTHPGAYRLAERVEVPDILLPALERYRRLASPEEKAVALPGDLPPLAPASPWPAVSVVVPVYGGADDLDACLSSLAPLHAEGLLHQVIVVDDATPEGDGQAEAVAAVASRHAFVTFLRREENGGFAAACNAGAEAATGDLLLFLNSDAAVPRAGLLRLAESLVAGGPLCAAAGPLSDNAGHGQQVAPDPPNALDLADPAALERLADDFARRDPQQWPDRDVDMLVGFCLLVKRGVFQSLGNGTARANGGSAGGGFDTRFGRGTFEDNDLCYRLRREGYRLVLSARSFVRHAGSKTLNRAVPDASALLSENHALYLDKWWGDLSGGFASHLSGLAPSPDARIVFDPARHPDRRAEEVRRRAREADVSLVMIVKDEERVLGAALSSARPYFSEMVVVDTGSADRTVEIAEAAGAKVHHFPWQDSFSAARNESLRHANGRWVFWMDADDTLPPGAGEALLACALSAPEDVAAFVVPVQFVETDNGDGTVSPGGTRVDHVKLFRNLPGLAFEGRIHEQILPSLRRIAGEGCRIARAPEGCVVLHSGYDTSREGQARKRERDAKLLALDLQERPGHPFVLFNLGMTDHYGSEHGGAVKWLRECVAASGDGESHLRKAYALLSVSLREMGDAAGALSAAEEGLARVPGGDPELSFQAGLLLAGMGRYAEAREHYQRCAGADVSGHFTSLDVGILGYKAFHNLAQVCLLDHDYGAARGWWLRAMADAPRFLPSAFDLFSAALEQRPVDAEGARAALDHVERVEGPSENWASMAAKLAEAEGGDDPGAGAALLGRLAADRPEATAVRLALARRLLALERVEEAAPHLEALADAGVAEGAFCLGVAATRRGDFQEALSWMERALQLNPGHEQTAEQAAALRRALAAGEEGVGEPPALPAAGPGRRRREKAPAEDAAADGPPAPPPSPRLLRLHVGAGGMRLPGFLNVDVRKTPGADLVGHAGRLPQLPDGSVELLFCNALFEHLFPAHHAETLAEWRRLLSPEGVAVCLGVPDFEQVARLYLAADAARGVADPRGRFDLFEAARYTHGELEATVAGGRAAWASWRPEERPDAAPAGYVPQLHKGLFDAPYLSGLLSASGLRAAVFRYRFPGEAHALNLGFVAARRQLVPVSPGAHGDIPGEPLRDAVLAALGRVPGAGTFAEPGSVRIATA